MVSTSGKVPFGWEEEVVGQMYYVTRSQRSDTGQTVTVLGMVSDSVVDEWYPLTGHKRERSLIFLTREEPLVTWDIPRSRGSPCVESSSLEGNSCDMGSSSLEGNPLSHGIFLTRGEPFVT